MSKGEEELSVWEAGRQRYINLIERDNDRLSTTVNRQRIALFFFVAVSFGLAAALIVTLGAK